MPACDAVLDCPMTMGGSVEYVDDGRRTQGLTTHHSADPRQTNHCRPSRRRSEPSVWLMPYASIGANGGA